MKEYTIVKLNDANNDVLLICMSHENIYQHLEEVQQEKAIRNGFGNLILDQLLVTGNSVNRFVSIPYQNGQLNLSLAANMSANSEIRQITVDVLRKHISVVKNSILTDVQQNMIQDGLVF